MNRVLCVWLPNWPVQRLLAARPELRERGPVVLYRERRRGGLEVVACSAAARARGVAPGMTVAEARSQGAQERCRLERHDPAADRAALEALAAWCEPFSPTVGLEDGPEPESLLLDVTGLGPLFGSEAALREQLVARFEERGFVVRTALADTVGAAWALARAEGGVPERVLPVELLRLGPAAVERLRELGLRTIGQLEALPRAGLAPRFGPELLLRLDQFFGRVPELIVAHRPPPVVQRAWTFECPTERREQIEASLQQLLAEMARELAARGQGALRFDCRLQGDSGRAVEVSVGLFRPSAQFKHLRELLLLRLESLELAEPVAALRLDVVSAAPLEVRQRELFAGEGPGDDACELAALVDRLSSRLGAAAVTRARPWPDAAPERAVRYEAAIRAGTVRRVRSKWGLSPSSCVAVPCARPLLLYRRPLRVAVLAVVPGSFPARVCVAGREHAVARRWGPERIETGWWRDEPARRDYYRVETAAGQRLWLFRNLRDGQWFLHGWFA